MTTIARGLIVRTPDEWDTVPVGAVIVTRSGAGSAWIHLATGHWTNGPSCYSTKTLRRAHGTDALVLWAPPTANHEGNR